MMRIKHRARDFHNVPEALAAGGGAAEVLVALRDGPAVDALLRKPEEDDDAGAGALE